MPHILGLLIVPFLSMPAHSQEGSGPSGVPSHVSDTASGLRPVTQQLSLTDKDCAWLKSYVTESAVDGSFPLGPERVTWSIASPSTISPAFRELHRKLVASIIKELDLPVSPSTDQNTAQLFIYFHTKKESAADTETVLSELRSSPRMARLFPENVPSFEVFSFNTCAVAYGPEQGQKVGKLTVWIPFDRRTGAPVTGATSCVTEGLLKAFGIGLEGNGIERYSWTANCPRCVETDRRMALILSQNSRSAQHPISVDEMFRQLTGTKCHS